MLKLMFEKRGQASTEMMVVLALVFVLLAFVLTINQGIMSGVQGEYDSRKAKIALDKIVQAGKLAYQQGEGAELKIYVTIPPNIEGIDLQGREINITMNINGQKNLIYRVTDYNVTGEIPMTEGNYWIRVKSEEMYVNFSNYYS
jgi:uncharacterized protein (UPF0333 family)